MYTRFEFQKKLAYQYKRIFKTKIRFATNKFNNNTYYIIKFHSQYQKALVLHLTRI